MNGNSKIKKILYLVGVVGGIVWLDHLSKVWILHNTSQLPRPLTSFCNIVFVQNRGVSFGLFKAGSEAQVLLLSFLALAVATGLTVWYWRCSQFRVSGGLLLIIAGALGNVMDRLLWGSVVDFIDLYLFHVHFPAFNLADSCITLGGWSVLWEQLRQPSHKKV
jgi:signal peptidase II